MAKYIDDELHIESQNDLEKEMSKYKCKTPLELADFLWYNYGVLLIID